MVTVLPNVTPGNKLYALGMPKMSSDSRSLAYGDGKTSLPWIADTAWEAPLRYTPPSQSAPPSADLWRAYVWDRATKGFTAVLVALAPQYVAQLPANNVVPGFRPLAGCSPANGTVIPNECNQSVLPNLGCKTTWSFTWSDPTGTATLPAVCTAASGKITLNKPLACPSTSPCDRVLILTNNEFPQPSPVSGNSLAVWTETTDSSTSSVQAQFVDDAGDPVGDPIVISEDDYTFAKLPTITLDPSGNYFVAWQTEYPDGTLDAISTQWLDPDGNPIGDPQQVASLTDGQQAEPAWRPTGSATFCWPGPAIVSTAATPSFSSRI